MSYNRFAKMATMMESQSIVLFLPWGHKLKQNERDVNTPAYDESTYEENSIAQCFPVLLT